ncbi:unnamed protein product [Ectocarpus fasciculatus]
MASKIPRALIGGNWKCNGTLAQVRDRIKVLNAAVPFAQSSEVVIATPSLHLPLCKEQFHPSINVASQDVGFKKGFGAYTGEMSAEMLVDAGIKWTLTGHSERRVGFGYPGEPSSVVGIKTKNALDAGMSAIFCLGEHLTDREKGVTMKVCAEQLEGLKAAGLSEQEWERIVLAYEPVWAIGTGVTASPLQAQETHSEIRQWLRANVSAKVAAETRIIYGGSATADNCDELYAMPDINGFLVGGASLKPDFIKIINCTK